MSPHLLSILKLIENNQVVSDVEKAAIQLAIKNEDRLEQLNKFKFSRLEEEIRLITIMLQENIEDLEKKTRAIEEQKQLIEKEKENSNFLLFNILPEEVAEELKIKGSADAKYFDEVTVMFTDFKGFTQLSEKLTPEELVGEIHECFSAFDHIMQKYGVEKIKTIGDSYMAAGGIPSTNKTHASDVVNAALDIKQFMHAQKLKKQSEGKLFFEIRIGVHTGAVVAGIVGVKKFAYDIWGDCVNTASRMESSGEIGKVNISETTFELVKHNFNCEYRGKIHAKNKGEIDMYFVELISQPEQ